MPSFFGELLTAYGDQLKQEREKTEAQTKLDEQRKYEKLLYDRKRADQLADEKSRREYEQQITDADRLYAEKNWQKQQKYLSQQRQDEEAYKIRLQEAQNANKREGSYTDQTGQVYNIMADGNYKPAYQKTEKAIESDTLHGPVGVEVTEKPIMGAPTGFGKMTDREKEDSKKNHNIYTQASKRVQASTEAGIPANKKDLDIVSEYETGMSRSDLIKGAAQFGKQGEADNKNNKDSKDIDFSAILSKPYNQLTEEEKQFLMKMNQLPKKPKESNPLLDTIDDYLLDSIDNHLNR